MSKKTKNLLIVISIIMIICIALYSAQYTIDGFKLVKIGKIIIENTPDDSKIFIDGERRLLSFQTGKNSTKRLRAGEHSILVAKDEYWPWMKNVEVKKGQKIILRPFLLSKYPQIEMIDKSDSQYESLLNEIKSFIPKTESNRELSSDLYNSIWIEDNTIYASVKLDDKNKDVSELCDLDCAKFSVFSSPSKIRNISFLNDRDDVLIFNTERGIFAIELDRNSPQNFQPIYDGLDVYFAKIDGIYYISDKDNLARVKI